ncbi:MAG: hypothetical protein AB2809_00325 [Candidatus Thiodiazotropha sp.]
MDIEDILKLIVPVITALIGLIGGYIFARSKHRSDKERSADKLAVDLLNAEWDRRASDREKSDFSAIAHYAVLRRLLDEYEGPDLVDADLIKIRDDLDEKYTIACSNGRNNHESLLKIARFIAENSNKAVVKQFYEMAARGTEIRPSFTNQKEKLLSMKKKANVTRVTKDYSRRKT